MNKVIFSIISILTSVIISYGQGTVVYQEGAIHHVEQFEEVNSEFSEICPAIVGDDLYFSLNRNSNTYKKTTQNNFYSEYKVTLDSLGNVESPLKMRGEVVSSATLVPGFGNNYHEGPVCYCPSTGELFTTMSQYTNPDLVTGMIPVEEIKLSIVVKKEVNGVWQTQRDFKYNQEGYNVAHPAITSAGDTLYFVSDMPGGFGGNDIYYCVRNESGWGEPHNLGSSVNTSGDEMFPCLTGQGQLFFSSDGFDGEGGLDLYYVNFPITDESLIYALKSPVNSSADDFGLTFDQKRGLGYFASDRKGGSGSDDLYIMTLDSIQVDLIAVSTETGEYLPNTEIILKSEDGDMSFDRKTDLDGKLSITLAANRTYEFEAYKNGYSVGKRSFDLKISNLLTGKYTERINMDPNDNNIWESTPDYSYNPYYVLFDFDKSTVQSKYTSILKALAKAHKENSCLILLLGGHTDSEGTDEYNQKLSERRASAVMDILIKSGADANRLRIVGYGEGHPLVEGNDDEVMAQNRRVDFTNVSSNCEFNIDSLFQILEEITPQVVEVEKVETPKQTISKAVVNPSPVTSKYSVYIVEDGGSFHIQFGAFKDKTNAEKVNNDLKTAFTDQGSDFIVIVDGLYKVRLGKFTSKEDAISFCEKNGLKRDK